MKTDIIGHDEKAIGVEVIYERDIRHIVNVEWNGSIEKHSRDKGTYPKDPEDRTFEEQRLMSQVKERARFAAQQEFPDADILSPGWQPEELDRAMLALEKLHVDDFAQEFRDCYRMLTNPASEPEVPEGSAEIIFQPFLVNEDDEVEYVPTPIIQYRDESGEAHYTHRESRYEELLEEPHLTKFVITLPPVEFDEGAYEFPDGFQILIIEHMLAQLRDVYLNMGEEPPEEIDKTDIWGKPLTTEDEEYYE